MPEIKFQSEDVRGKCFALKIREDLECCLMDTKAGHIRGGITNNVDQYHYLIEGKVIFKQMFPDGEVETILEKGEAITTPKNVPHLLIAIQDSWWLSCHKLPKVREEYEPYRKMVRERYKGKKLVTYKDVFCEIEEKCSSD